MKVQTAAATALIAICIGCQSDQSSEYTSNNRSEPLTVKYPRMPWRLAPEKLSQTRLWFSHIVLTSANTRKKSRVATHLAHKKHRSLRQARLLARELSHSKQSFEALAQQHSDDLTSRERGGAMGGWHASELPSDYLDVLASLDAGQVSQPFDTVIGTHLIRLDAPPTAEPLAALGIMIGFNGPHEEHLGFNRNVTRTRLEAVAKASRIRTQLASTGAPFEEFVQTHSDHEDAQRGERFVTKSRNTGSIPYVLSQLEVGQISQPIDTSSGVIIVKRIPASQANTPARDVDLIRLPYKRNVTDTHAQSRSTVLTIANELTTRLKNTPDQWKTARSSYCCAAPERWYSDTAVRTLWNALAQLDVGEHTTTPVEARQAFWLLRRASLDTVIENTKTVRFELAQPKHADFGTLATIVKPVPLAARIGAFWIETRLKIKIDSAYTKYLDEIFQNLVLNLPAMPSSERPGAINNAIMEVRSALPKAQFETFMQRAYDLADSALMATR